MQSIEEHTQVIITMKIHELFSNGGSGGSRQSTSLSSSEEGIPEVQLAAQTVKIRLLFTIQHRQML